MQVKTILNQLYKFRSHVYKTVRLFAEGGKMWIEVDIVARQNGRIICSCCGRPASHYDTQQPPRRFDFVPLWNLRTIFCYSMRRVDCRSCGIKIEAVPWAQGKQRRTHAFTWFIAAWARKLNWKQTAVAFQTSWNTVFSAVQTAVEWGLEHRNTDEIRAIGVDEIAYKKGQNYLTLVYQIQTDCRRLLWVGKGRTKKTLEGFFDRFQGKLSSLQYVASDMWKPYLDVIAEYASQAIHVLDRFHIMAHFSKAIDEVRAQEARKLKEEGKEPVLKGTRFLLLKRPENLTQDQEIRLADLLKANLKTVRAYLLKEDFQFFWGYISPYWAGQFMDRWCERAMKSGIEPIKKRARSLRRHRELLVNWFWARGEISSGMVEGFNNKAKVTTRNAYGFRNPKHLEIALFHALGKLPEPKFTHRFG